MKKYKNIDELFKEELSDMELAPSSGVWGKIRKRVFNGISYRHLLLPGIFILLGIPFYMYLSNNNERLVSETTDISIETQNDKNQSFEVIQTGEPLSDSNQYQNSYIPDQESNTKNTQPTENRSLETATNETFGVNVYANSTYEQNESHNPRYNILEISKNHRISLYDTYPDSVVSRNKTISIEAYREKRKQFHAYYSITASAGIMYYEDSQDMFTWSVDIGVGYKIKKIIIETGIGIESADHQGDYRIDYETKDSVGYYNEVVSFELNPVNPDEIQYNTRKTIVYDSVSHYQLKNPVYNYSYINIPLIAGYRFFEKDRISMSVQTGVVFSILNKTTIPDVKFDDTEATLLSIVNHTPDRAKTNIKYNIGLRINYKVHRGISIGIQPEFNHYLNSVYGDESGKKLTPYSIKLRAGIYFNF